MSHKGMYFIPLIGAAAVPEDDFESHYDEAYVAAMGPVFGLATAVACGVFYFLFSTPIAAAAAAWIAMINLFNLLPVKPLDGGRIVAALSFSISSSLGFVITFGALALATIGGVKFGLGIIYIIVPLGTIEMIGEYRSHKNGLDKSKPLADHALQDIYNTFDVKPREHIPRDVLERDCLDYLNDTIYPEQIVTDDITPAEEAGSEHDQIHFASNTTGNKFHAHPEPVFWELLADDEIARTKPPMTFRGIVGTTGVYLGLGGLLLGVMVLMLDVPGAAVAMEALR